MIQYIKGDATYPERIKPEGIKIIVHIVNNIGAWGAGFVLALNKRWDKPKECYKKLFNNINTKPVLGQIDIIKVDDEKDIYVVNLVGQSGIRAKKISDVVIGKDQTMFEIKNNMVMPIRYDAIYKGLLELKLKLNCLIKTNCKYSIHMPKIGSGLAGGDWLKIEKIINKIFVDENVYVYIYH